jgi:hypothetical protein
LFSPALAEVDMVYRLVGKSNRQRGYRSGSIFIFVGRTSGTHESGDQKI